LKYEECETLNEELRLAYTQIKSSESNAQVIIQNKEDEVINLTNKINELDVVINKYGQNLSSLKKSHDKVVYDHEVQLINKNKEMKIQKDSYEKKIKELQSKIEEILLKENDFIHKINEREAKWKSYGQRENEIYNYGSSTTSTNVNHNVYRRELNLNSQYKYVPKEIPDDEEVRRNITEQINYVNLLLKLDQREAGPELSLVK
jgi:tetrahydromethanopterin S-methyltransferase subunit B